MRYMPILKSKPAEYASLARADVAVRAASLPLVEVLPPPDESDAVATEIAARTVVVKVGDGWSEPVAIDPGHLDVALPSPAGLLPVEVLADEARTRGVAFMPVVRLNDPPAALAAAAGVIASDRRGAVLRIAGDLLEDTASLDSWISDTQRDLGVGGGDLDVVIDLGAVGAGSGFALAARVARDLINGLSGVTSWRSLTLASGAFPTDLNAIATGTTGLLPRLDAQLWADLSSRTLVRVPDFGDYAIQHPSLPSTGGFGPAPQIRYTVGPNWRIYKGRKNDRRGHAQFYDICAMLLASGEFAGRALSWGDAYVEDAARSAGGAPVVTTGNATTWRSIGTSHHIATVVSRLATTHAP